MRGIKDLMKMVEEYINQVKDPELSLILYGMKGNLGMQLEIRETFEKEAIRMADKAKELYDAVKQGYNITQDVKDSEVDSEKALFMTEITILETAIVTLCEKLAMRFNEDNVFIAQARIMKKFLEYKGI